MTLSGWSKVGGHFLTDRPLIPNHLLQGLARPFFEPSTFQTDPLPTFDWIIDEISTNFYGYQKRTLRTECKWEIIISQNSEIPMFLHT